MERADILACIRDSLRAITVPRFFESERGFQGELLVQLAKRMHLYDGAIVEQEHQKRLLEHGLTIRPDIIIHEWFDPARHAARTDGNIAVLELKINATAREATEDFESLAAMIQVLHYPLGIFVNVGSTATHGNLVPEAVRGRVVSFAVALLSGKAQVIEQ